MDHGSGPAHRLTGAERLELLQRVRAGETHSVAATTVGCSAMTVQRALRTTGGVKPRTLARSTFRLSLSEREDISRGLLAGDSCRTIATRLGRSPSTVSRDVAASGARVHYRAWRADERAQQRARRPKVSKLVACPRLRAEVERRLRRRWSPQQIAARLIRDFPGEPEMRVSHETIYQSLFVQGRGALRKELTRCLRSGRAQRRPHGRVSGTGRLKDMVLLSERPAEAEDRAIPGHWEGDLLLGKLGQSAIGTLVERQTRYVMLVHLPHGRLAEDVMRALTKAIRTLPAHLHRSLTWDQGKEIGAHARFTVATGVQVYFCDPRSPWQRATSENTNGLLRQYFPKGAALADYTQAKLNAVAMEVNGRPRQTLGWDTPAEAFARVVAITA